MIGGCADKWGATSVKKRRTAGLKVSWGRQGGKLEPLFPRVWQMPAQENTRLGLDLLKCKYLIHSCKFLIQNPECTDLVGEDGKKQWSLTSMKKPFPPPTLPLHMLRGVWRISSEKWYCKLDRGRNWVHLRMKSNCIVNTFSFSFHLYPFCYFLFSCPDFHSSIVSHFSSIIISCNFVITISFCSDFGNIYIFLLSIPMSLCLFPLNDHILEPVFHSLAWILHLPMLRWLLPSPHPQRCRALSLMWGLKKKAIGAYIHFLLAAGSQFCGGNITTNKTVSCQPLRWPLLFFRGANVCNILIFDTPQKNLCVFTVSGLKDLVLQDANKESQISVCRQMDL